MSDGDEGDGKAAAEEHDEEGRQPVAVVDAEGKVGAWGLDSLLGRPLEGGGGEPSGRDPSVPGDHLEKIVSGSILGPDPVRIFSSIILPYAEIHQITLLM